MNTLLSVDAQAVAGHADHALDVFLLHVGRRLEGDDHAALDLDLGQQQPADRAERFGIGHLADQQVVADEQRFLHGGGGDDERLQQEGVDEKDVYQGLDDQLEILAADRDGAFRFHFGLALEWVFHEVKL